jgi:penicillin-binding protein 1A
VPLPDEIGTDATVLVDSAGRELGSLEPGREEIALDAVPDHVVLAVLAAEDASFYDHRGVSIPGLFRAAIVNVLRGGVRQGGSTISQQYVKTVTQDTERTALRKVREAALAVKLERQFSKDQILEFYLNTIYFGRGAYGIQAAAQAFYGKGAADLDVAEAAQLAGLIPAPSRLDPLENPEGADRRYRYVLNRMVAEGWLSAGEAGQLSFRRPIPVDRRGAAFDNAPFFLDVVRRELEQVLGTEDVYRGLRVTTTLNFGVQKAAERAYAAAFDGIAPTGAIVAVDPGTGGVRALVGGRNYATDQLNLATNAQGRQPGSTFKPFALAAWIEAGNSPDSYFDAPPTLTYDWNGRQEQVTNYGGAGYAPMSLREATWRSVNTVYVELGLQVGLDRVADIAHRAGIPESRQLAATPSLVLGSYNVSPLDLAEAYNTFATGGVHRDAHTVVQVERAGDEVYRARPRETRAFSEQVAYTVTDVLRGVLTSGTGSRAAIGRPAAGKTGTTQGYGDAWFAGYTPHLTAVVWMGNRDNRERMEGDPTGGGLPAQAWAAFMSDALTGVPAADFPRPTGDLRVVTPALPPEPTVPDCPEGQEPGAAEDGSPGTVCVDVTPTPEPTPEPTAEPSEPTPAPTGDATAVPLPGPHVPGPHVPAPPGHQPAPSEPPPEPSPDPQHDPPRDEAADPGGTHAG